MNVYNLEKCIRRLKGVESILDHMSASEYLKNSGDMELYVLMREIIGQVRKDLIKEIG